MSVPLPPRTFPVIVAPGARPSRSSPPFSWIAPLPPPEMVPELKMVSLPEEPWMAMKKPPEIVPPLMSVLPPAMNCTPVWPPPIDPLS